MMYLYQIEPFHSNMFLKPLFYRCLYYPKTLLVKCKYVLSLIFDHLRKGYDHIIYELADSTSSLRQVLCMFYRYSFEGVLQAIYGFDRDTLECEKQPCYFSKPEEILQQMDVQDAKFYIDFIVLCAFFVILRIGCYFVLRWRVKAER